MEVFGSARAGVLPKQQVIDRQLAISVALTLRQQLLHNKHKSQYNGKYTGCEVRRHREHSVLKDIQIRCKNNDALTGWQIHLHGQYIANLRVVCSLVR